jgi:hypothetical protein
MRNLLNAISNSLLSRELGDCSLQEISDLARSQPYSGSVQLLLAQKLKDQADPSWEHQWQKTLLYFDNPAALHYWFTKKPVLSPWEKEITDNPTESGVAETDIVNHEEAQPVITEPQPAAVTQVAETDEVSHTFPSQDPEAAVVVPTAETEVSDTLSSQDPEAAAAVTPTAETVISDTLSSQDPQAAAVAGKEEQVLPAFTIQHQGAGNTELVFTPYHTVDYFASQGIKLSEDKNTRDRFTQQLKSFSDWLKEMKRLPEAERSARLVGKEERKVEEMAGKSLTGENAITEAMAEIWIKQGNPANALSVYQKLSLQNPLKRAYFAAKIEHLKKSL